MLSMENKLVGNYFKSVRLKRGYSEEYMSYRLNVSQSTISNVENGKIKIDVVRIMEFCNVLEITLIELVHAMITAVGGEIPKPPVPENNDPVSQKLDAIMEQLNRQNQLIAELMSAMKKK